MKIKIGSRRIDTQSNAPMAMIVRLLRKGYDPLEILEIMFEDGLSIKEVFFSDISESDIGKLEVRVPIFCKDKDGIITECGNDTLTFERNGTNIAEFLLLVYVTSIESSYGAVEEFESAW